MFNIAVFWGVVVLCVASLDVENELKEIRTILVRQEREIQELRGENKVLTGENKELRSENRVFKSENGVFRADVRRMATEIEKIKNDFARTEIVLNSTSLNIEAMKSFNMERHRVTRLASEPVGFYAYMGSDESDPSNHHAIIFDRVVTNEGHGYNKFSGLFTSPSPGLYFFSWTIYSGGHGQTKFNIYVNYSSVDYTFSDTAGTGKYDSHSGSMVVKLQTGDSVYIRSGMDCTTSIISNSAYGYSTFAGGKLF